MNAIKPTQRLVRRNSTETVKHLMFLFGVKAVPHPEFAEAVFVIADKWQEGFEDGMAIRKKKPSLFRSIAKSSAPRISLTTSSATRHNDMNEPKIEATHPALARTWWMNLYPDGLCTGTLCDTRESALNRCTYTGDTPDAVQVEVRMVLVPPNDQSSATPGLKLNNETAAQPGVALQRLVRPTNESSR